MCGSAKTCPLGAAMVLFLAACAPQTREDRTWIRPYEVGSKLPGGYVVEEVASPGPERLVVTIERSDSTVAVRFDPHRRDAPAFTRAGRCDVTWEGEAEPGARTPEELARAVDALARAADRHDACATAREEEETVAWLVGLAVFGLLVVAGGLAMSRAGGSWSAGARFGAWAALVALAAGAAVASWLLAGSGPSRSRPPPASGGAATSSAGDAAAPPVAPPGPEALHAFIDELLDRAEARDAAGIESVLESTWERVRDRPGLDPQVEAVLETRTRLRIAGWARCRVLASRDPSWCGMLDGLLEGESSKCKAVTTMWVLVGDEVMRGDESCEGILDRERWRFGNLEDHGLAFCSAISRQRPELCPARFDGTPGSPICEAAAGGDAGQVCGSDPRRPGWWTGCCERFAGRFAAFVAPEATPATSPELGAVGGDAAGCDRALERALASEVGFAFGSGDVPGDLDGLVVGGEAACRPVVPWSPARR